MQLSVQKKHIESKLEELNKKSQEDKVNDLETVLNKFKGILSGEIDLEARDINQLFTSIIEKIEYKRVGDHKAEIELTIHFNGQSEEQG